MFCIVLYTTTDNNNNNNNNSRAREASPRDQLAKTDPIVEGPGALFSPPSRPNANIHRLFGDPGSLQKSTDFRDPQNRPRWGQSRPLAAPRPPMAPFGRLSGSILGPIFDYFLILFLNPQNQDFAIPYHTFCDFSIPKALIFGPLFDNFFDPILGPPLEEPFGPSWPPKVPTLPPHVDFGAFLGPPMGSKMGPWSAQGRPRGAKKAGSSSYARGPVCVLDAPCAPKGSREPFLSTWGPPWVIKVPFWDPLG